MRTLCLFHGLGVFLTFFLALFLQPLVLRHVQSPHDHSLSSTVDADELDETSNGAHGSANVPRPTILRIGSVHRGQASR
jgi:hypothetical protein